MELSRKKVLFLITKSNWGGAQRYVFDLATTLDPAQYDVTVALGGNGVLIEKLRDAGIRVYQIPSLQRDISFKKELLAFRDIALLLKTTRPDVLHVNSSKAGGIGAFLGRWYRIPRIIYTAHGWAFNEDRSALSKKAVGFFHWLTIQCAHHTIAVSKEVQRQMRWPGTQKKMTVIYNGRDPIPYLNRNEARHFLIDHHPTLAPYRDDYWTGTIAELHPIKRHEVMIHAVHKLHQAGVTVRHIIIGGGELHNQLQSLIKTLKLTEQIFLLGAIEEASRFLKAFDLFTLTSRSEAFAYVMIEATQAGLPIVASNVGGIPEIITSGETGTLVPPDSVAAVVTAVQQYCHSPEVATAHATAASAYGHQFTLERMVAETSALYS